MPSMVTSLTIEKENPFIIKDKVVKKIKHDKIAPNFSLNINSKKTTNSKYQG